MGQPLTGNEVQATYEGLLKTSSNATLATSSLEPVSDGAGNDSALLLAQEQAALKGTYVEISNTTQGSGILVDEAQGDKVLYYGTQDFQFATVTGLPDTNTTYTISAQQDGANVDVNLNGSDASVDTVTLVAGTNITLSQTGDNITIDAAGGGAGLINGSETDSLVSAPALTTTAASAQSVGSIVLGNGASDNTISPLGKHVILGDNAKATGGEWTVVIGKDSQTNRGESVILGAGNTNNGGYGAIIVGSASTINGEDGIVIGRANTNYAQKAIIIGSGNDNSDVLRVKSIIIGNSSKAAQRAIVIGSDNPNYASADSIQIGNNNQTTLSNFGINLGNNNYIADYKNDQIAIGRDNQIQSQENIVIGKSNTVGGSADGTIFIGGQHTGTGGRNVGVGYQTVTTGGGEDKIAIGTLCNATADRAVVIGRNSTSSHANAVVLGQSMSSVAADTTHVAGLNVGVVNEYADNTAAVSAGLAIGQIYRTGDLLKIVHA